jgi:predicted acylesterase/phospholipase RssA
MENELQKPTVLVLGPGGMKGFLQLGALFFLEKKGYIDEINSISGCSIDSIIGLLLICGYSVYEIIEEAIHFDLFSDVNSVDLSQLFSKMGVLPHSYRDRLIYLVRSKLGVVPSLGDLYLMTRISFSVVSMNLDLGKPVYFTSKTYPELSCVDAVTLSCNIPFVFERIRYRNHTYIDGAFGDPLLVSIFDEPKGKNLILVLYIADKKSSPTSKKEEMMWYVNSIVHCSIDRIRDLTIENFGKNILPIRLRSTSTDTLGITFSSEKKISFLNDGIDIVSQWYSKKTNSSLEEIFSDGKTYYFETEVPIPIEKEEKDPNVVFIPFSSNDIIKEFPNVSK